MINGEKPSLITRDISRHDSFCSLRRTSARFDSARNSTAHSAERNCEITVATAAPLTPIPNTKMNSGSSATFVTAPITTVSIAVAEKPCAVMKLLSPTDSSANTLPSA